MADISIAPQTAVPQREPNESEDHYVLRLQLWQRDKQYDSMKRRFTWAAGIAAVATVTAVAFAANGRR